jgi:hypothetical protein
MDASCAELDQPQYGTVAQSNTPRFAGLRRSTDPVRFGLILSNHRHPSWQLSRPLPTLAHRVAVAAVPQSLTQNGTCHIKVLRDGG